MDADFANWFVGFTDGEGCFVIAQRSGRRSGEYKPAFALVVREDDIDIILTIQEQFGYGVVRHRIFTSPGSHNGIGWHIDDRAGLWRLVRFFDVYPLRSKKIRDFRVWREAVLEYQKDIAMRNQNKLAYLYNKLKFVRQYDPPEIEDFEPEGAQLEFWDNDID